MEKLPKSQRLRGEKRIGVLFAEGRRGSVEPVRFVWAVSSASTFSDSLVPDSQGQAGDRDLSPRARSKTDEASTLYIQRPLPPQGGADDLPCKSGNVSVLFSVPKKMYKRAWKRNLLKRRMRESYRRRKGALLEKAVERGVQLDLALVCVGPTVGKAVDKAVGKAVDKAVGKAVDKAVGSAAVDKKNAARPSKSEPSRSQIPDFKTIDNAIERILEKIMERL